MLILFLLFRKYLDALLARLRGSVPFKFFRCDKSSGAQACPILMKFGQ